MVVPVVDRGWNFVAERASASTWSAPTALGKSRCSRSLAGFGAGSRPGRTAASNVIATAYFPQNRLDVLNAEHTVLVEAMECARIIRP